MFETNKLSAKIAVIIVTLAMLGGTFGLGVWYGYDHRPSVEKVLGVAGKEPPPRYRDVDFNLFWDVWTRVEEKYVDKSKLDREKMVYGAIAGMVHALKDPYTDFFTPEISRQFQEDVKGSFSGIGAEIGIRKSILTIISPLKNSPAERAGLKAGDKVFKINDTAAIDLALDEAVRLIRGEKGTQVKLTIVRDGLDQAKEISITRDTIKIESVATESKTITSGGGDKPEEKEALPEGVFVITLNHFNEDAATAFRKAVQEFYVTNSKKLVLDLRNNPGGYLQVSVDIASWFLPAGDVVVQERFADGSKEEHRSSGYKLLENVPTVVLINEGSASASEILAGALRDSRGSKLIGAKSFGKGSVQEVVPLPKDASLKITIAKWLTPKGIEIDGKGLEPDVKVELPEDREKIQGDPVMKKALEVINGM
ncbi:MAG: S41 family peptidase [Candidatus Sungbacteria bacterium]|nr:S41 family peptidase [Candidatus Sungbacteria bacterium]